MTPQRVAHATLRGGDNGFSLPSQPPAPSGFSQFVPPAAATAAASASASVAGGFVRDNWVVLVVVVGIVALGGLLWWLIRQSQTATNGARASASVVASPTATDAYTRFPGKGLPASTNGQRLSLSMWIYVSDFSKNDGSFRHVIHVGQEDGSAASPIVFLDKNRNRLIVWFAKNGGPTADPAAGALLRQTSGVTLNGADASTSFQLNNHGIVVPYIPQQRWVHVAIVVDETVQATTITAYVDAEAVAQTSTGDLADDENGFPRITGNNQYVSADPGASNGAYKDLRDLNLTLSAGDVYTGGDAYGKAGVGFPGFVSRVAFYNYELNADDVGVIYRAGPYLSLWFGLGAYGLRTPVYRLADAQ